MPNLELARLTEVEQAQADRDWLFNLANETARQAGRAWAQGEDAEGAALDADADRWRRILAGLCKPEPEAPF